MSSSDYKNIHPREIANKSQKENLVKALKMSLAIESDAVRLNTQTFNRNRYSAINKISDYDQLKEKARKIKEESIENLPSLIDALTKTVEARGGKVFLAKDKTDATNYILNVCKEKDAKLVVKAKSITSEEIKLNEVLEKEDIEVAETDLAEFILQVSKEQPSHNVAPAIHRSRERITELFKENFKTARKLETGEELTEFARDILRQKFLSADIGISGANMIDAKTGSILLVESEGNIRLTTQLPAIHIAISGIEKIVPDRKDFAPFIELLAASGTGQSLTTYTNIIQPPLDSLPLNINRRNDGQREFHLVLIDNGRMQLRDDVDLKEALYCIRCSACMNVCANFQTVGGHSFGGECYTGGIGGAWTASTSKNLLEARFAELCTGCSRCVPNCPVKIDIPYLNTVLKERIAKADGGPSLQKKFFGGYSTLAKFTSLTPNLVNRASDLTFTRNILEKSVGFDKRRSVPKTPNNTLEKDYFNYRKSNRAIDKYGLKTILFADIFTNYDNPDCGIAIIKVFDKLGIEIGLSKVMPDGRAPQSQGLITKASKSAKKLAQYLSNLINDGYEIIVAEPSVLAMFRYDYKKMIKDDILFQLISDHSFDPLEYIEKIYKQQDESVLVDLKKSIQINNYSVFLHGHCQLKSIGADIYTKSFFEQLGFKFAVSNSECCGMAGSFGYKKDFYDLSKNIGNELITQIQKFKNELSSNKYVILASGTSCREQISDLGKINSQHPIEFLETLLT
jgi:iron-sulfur cluster protein